ncbi:hypothetical protein CHS0354_004082 [Potamilus streckersoni]|uniref:Uncharacterized protein n=1 Tax=Potamilus streckersoni TaxID=2493646 RepID=A0AAE0T806_9BIVA|nr:hypothetical protein CHS0354_004082 [Potamilus streckersoni]
MAKDNIKHFINKQLCLLVVVNLSSFHESPPVTPDDSAFNDDILGIATPDSCPDAQMTLDSGKPLSPDISGLNEQPGRTTEHAANSLPPWLQMELEEAEYIPLPENYHQQGGQSQGYEYSNQEEAHGGPGQCYVYGDQEEEHASNFSSVDLKCLSKSNINSHYSADNSNFGQAQENSFQVGIL